MALEEKTHQLFQENVDLKKKVLLTENLRYLESSQQSICMREYACRHQMELYWAKLLLCVILNDPLT